MRPAALALLLCGCGWSGAGGAERGALVLANRAGYGRARLETTIVESYLATHPGLHVIQWHPSSNPIAYRRRLIEAMSSGTPPEVALLDLSDVPPLGDQGMLLDLSPYLARVGVTPGEYDSTVLSAFRRGRAIYALPTGYSPLVIAYNKDLFDRAGLSSPAEDWTWDDFLGLAKRLTHDSDNDGKVDVWGTDVDSRVTVWLAWIWAGGGEVLCADGKRATGCLDSPATIAALRWYAGLVTQENIAPRASHDIELFLDGKLAMLTVDHAVVPQLKSRVAAGRLRVGFATIPHRMGFAPATVLTASAYAVPAQALRRKLAVELAASLTDSLAGRVRGEAGLEIPALSSIATALAARDTLGWEAVFMRAVPEARIPWEARIARWTEVEAALSGMMDRIMLEGADPEAAAHDMALQLDHLLGAR